MYMKIHRPLSLWGRLYVKTHGHLSFGDCLYAKMHGPLSLWGCLYVKMHGPLSLWGRLYMTMHGTLLLWGCLCVKNQRPSIVVWAFVRANARAPIVWDCACWANGSSAARHSYGCSAVCTMQDVPRLHEPDRDVAPAAKKRCLRAASLVSFGCRCVRT